MRPSRGTLVRLAVSLAALALIGTSMRGKLDEASHILRSEVAWPWVIASAGTYLAALVWLAVRLQVVCRVQEIHLNFGESFYLGFVGLFFNLFFPSAVGGDIAKAYFIYKHTHNKVSSTTSVLLDRLLGFVALISMAVLVSIAFGRRFADVRTDLLVYAFLAVMLASMLFFASRRIARRFQFFHRLIPSAKIRENLAAVYHAIYGYKHHAGALFSSVLLSFIAQSIFVFVHYTVTRSLGIRLPVWLFFILVPVISVVSMAPSLGGLGVREAGVIYFFKRFMTAERALAMSLLLDMLIYSFSLAGGLIFAFSGGLKRKVIHEMEELGEPG